MTICKGLKFAFVFGAFALICACQSSNQAMANRSKDDTYPDLLAIPPMPTSIKTEKEWALISGDVEKKAKFIRTLPAARDYDEREWNIESLKKSAKIVNQNSKNAPPPNMDEALAWAARLRATMEKHKN